MVKPGRSERLNPSSCKSKPVRDERNPARGAMPRWRSGGCAWTIRSVAPGVPQLEHQMEGDGNQQHNLEAFVQKANAHRIRSTEVEPGADRDEHIESEKRIGDPLAWAEQSRRGEQQTREHDVADQVQPEQLREPARANGPCQTQH